MARDWLDYAGTLLLPAVIAVGGIAYTAHKDAIERDGQEAQHAAEAARLAFDRDTGFIRLLTSTSDRERDLGLRMIDVLRAEGRFSADLVPVVAAVARGRPSDPTVQAAGQLLRDVARSGANGAAAQSAAQAAQASAVTARQGRIAVYIQIAREDQRDAAQRLQATLRAGGYDTPGVELVANGTANTYVRYFAARNAQVAGEIDARLKSLGFASSVQNFANGRAPLPQIEIWIGSRQAPVPAGPGA